MKTFTEKELFQWLFRQPDERPVNMSLGCIDDRCGCILAEFCKDHGILGFKVFVNGKVTGERIGKSIARVEVKAKFRSADERPNIFAYFSHGANATTMGKLKQVVKKDLLPALD